MQPVLAVRVFIASPGDVAAERQKAVDVVTEWNAAHSVDRDALIEAVRMETHAQIALGDHPQEILNSTLLERCDLLVAMFWSKLGQKTNTEKSGTVHEIKAFIERKGAKNVLLFFSSNALPNDIDEHQLKLLREFKSEMQTQGLYKPYSDVNEFEKLLRHQLEMRMNTILKSEQARTIWRTRMNEESDTKERMRQHSQSMAESRRRIGETNTAVRDAAVKSLTDSLGVRNLPTALDDLRSELIKLCGVFERQWQNCHAPNHSEKAKRLARQIGAKLCDILDSLGYDSPAGVSSELNTILNRLNEIKNWEFGEDKMPSQFWSFGDDTIEEFNTVIELM